MKDGGQSSARREIDTEARDYPGIMTSVGGGGGVEEGWGGLLFPNLSRSVSSRAVHQRALLISSLVKHR